MGTHPLNDDFPQAFERHRIGIEAGYLPRQVPFPDFFEPVREIVFPFFQPQAGFKDMEIERIDADLLDNLAEFFEIPGFVGRRQNERLAGHEMEFLSGLTIAGPGRLPSQGPSEDVEKGPSEAFETSHSYNVDGGQFFAQRVLAEGVSHPESEIVRRLGRQKLVLLDEAVGVIINGTFGSGL